LLTTKQKLRPKLNANAIGCDDFSYGCENDTGVLLVSDKNDYWTEFETEFENYVDCCIIN